MDRSGAPKSLCFFFPGSRSPCSLHEVTLGLYMVSRHLDRSLLTLSPMYNLARRVCQLSDLPPTSSQSGPQRCTALLTSFRGRFREVLFSICKNVSDNSVSNIFVIIIIAVIIPLPVFFFRHNSFVLVRGGFCVAFSKEGECHGLFLLGSEAVLEVHIHSESFSPDGITQQSLSLIYLF